MRRRDDKFPDNGFEAWGGYMAAKVAKLEEQFISRAQNQENQLSNIFSGVSIFVNGFTNPSSDELKDLMTQHGGVYHTYQRSNDFMIASNLPDTKVKNMNLTRVVRPEWITDSIKSNQLLDYRNYLLYRNSKNQPTLDINYFKESSIVDSKLAISDKFSAMSACNKEIALPCYPKNTHSSTSKDNELTNEKSKQMLLEKNQTSDQNNFHTTKTAADPNFISEFYNNSRLHHISQLGACFKQHINNLREDGNFKFPARNSLKENILTLNNSNNIFSQIQFEKDKVIMHIDMDCFFVSVGLRTKPELRGKPVAVTHSKGGQPRPKRSGVDRNAEFSLYKQKQVEKFNKATGVPEDEIQLETRVDTITDEDDKYGSMSEIASCSYEARACGVTNGMFMGAALRLCPDIITIPYDFEGYKDVAYTLYNTIAQYTLDIEAVSCDEMYVDCTELLKSMDVSVQDFATVIREEIRRKTGCPCSTGFGGNRLQARLATKRAKPDGQFFLSTDLVEDFMFDIKLRDLPGVGRQTAHKLESIGHQTCGSLQNLSISSLQKHLGNKTGAQLFDQCRGRDNNPLSFHTVRKSVSAEVNYGIRFECDDQCVEFLKQLSAEIQSRMQQFKVTGKFITLKLMIRAEEAPVETAKFMGHGFCDVVNKSTSLTNATNDSQIIAREVISIYKKQNIDAKELRGIGIQVTKLEPANAKPGKGAISTFFTDKPSKDKLQIKKELPTTPKKAIKSPTKKSPIIGSVKSPSAKKRGRPPKSLKFQFSSSNTLINNFLHGQSLVKDTPFKNPISVKPKQEQISKPVVVEKPQGLRGLSWQEVRELLRAWLESSQHPLPCDINLIVEYMRDMVVDRNIDKLNILINFLRRRTREMNSDRWIEVTNGIVEEVQNTMLVVYGKKLFIE